MSNSLFLLLAITSLYAGYNLLIKVSSSFVEDTTASTILATISLQTVALFVSCLFATGLLLRGGTTFSLPPTAFVWAALAGVCIGFAEIGYFYLFRGMENTPPVAANIAIPFIVSGTIVIALLLSWLVLREPASIKKVLGALLIVIGVATIYFDKKPDAIIG